jgi:DNA-binding cell septation regulator SpoVG
MQQKVNSVTVQAGSEEKVFEDVLILKGSEGLYIETVEKIGTDNEGKDLLQPKLTMYPWEKVISMSWTEKTLIDAVKQGVILEALQEIEDFLEDYEDDEEEESSGDKRDDPEVNPYE